jgi:hypothetical protein
MKNPLENTGFTKPTDYDQLNIINPVAAAHKLFIAAVTETFTLEKCPLESVTFKQIEGASPDDIMHLAKQKEFTVIPSALGYIMMHMACSPIDGGRGTQWIHSTPVAEDIKGAEQWIADWEYNYRKNKEEKLSQVNADFDIITQTTK